MSQAVSAEHKTDVDEEDLRSILSHFATGITVVTGRDSDGRARAITVNAFTAVSLDPPLILYCLGKSAFTFDCFINADAFAVNILSVNQQALSDRFAREVDDHFPDLEIIELVSGSPILVDTLGVLDCTTHAVQEAGDHFIIVGRVVALRLPKEAEPLLYYRSRYLTPTS